MTPDPGQPTIILDGTKIVETPGPTPLGESAGSPNEPTFTPIVSCREDAGIGLYGCRDVDPVETDETNPEPTDGDVLRAAREIGLPSLQVKVQPGSETLVNVDTIFYTEPRPFVRDVELLGFDVDLVAEPVRFDWVHGDGTTRTTDRPGRPYPALDVTHRYKEPAEAVRARVDVTYRVRYRIDGGAWRTIGQTLSAAGAAAVLDVKEAAPVLAKP